jgi:Fe2+ transport system protein FeoA
MVAAASPVHATLGQLSKGQQAVIERFSDQQLAGRLMAMGVLPGSTVVVIRNAPFGGAFYVQVDHFLIALRTEEAEAIVIKELR